MPTTTTTRSPKKTKNVNRSNSSSGWQETKPEVRQRTGFLLNNSHLSDVLLVVGEGDVKKEFFGHKMILAMGSPVFEAQFFGDVQIQIQGANERLELPDMEPDSFYLFLKVYFKWTSVCNFVI